MNPLGKKIIAVAACASVLLLAYYGSCLPLRKSQTFIGAMRRMATFRSFSDFTEAFSGPLNMPSPIGQEELVRNVANHVLGFVERNRDRPELVRAFVDYVEAYFEPIIARGRGMSFEQNLYLLGILNEFAFVQTKEARYFAAAKRYYGLGRELGPKRPQTLYGMFDIYRMENNAAGAREVGEQILEQWPDDERTRAALAEFLAKFPSPPQ